MLQKLYARPAKKLQQHSSKFYSIMSEPTSTFNLVPCTTAEPHTRSDQLLATAWVQHLIHASLQGNAT